MITILMATYNGEAYIRQQLDSLLCQTVQEFVVHITDDLSTDNTFTIVEEYSKRYPEKMIASCNAENSGNAKLNFYNMMLSCQDDYIMLCDQDDVWKPDKIELTLAEMQRMEALYGMNTPLLVHTDLCVVDEQLKIISPSFKEAMNADYSRTQLRQLLIQNTVTGCTVLYNRALANRLAKNPPYMVMHDWWLVLVAAAFGRVGHLEQQTILYRQHGSNSIGAKDVRTLGYKINKLFHHEEIKCAIAQTYTQAASLLNAYEAQLSEDQKQLLRQYCAIPNKNKLGRWIAICRLGVLKHGIARKIANFIFI